jgi:transposase
VTGTPELRLGIAEALPDGYLNRVRSSRRQERQCRRNVKNTWLLSGLKPDVKTIGDFRLNNRSVGLCVRLWH